MSGNQKRKWDIVLFGATGYTGKMAVEQLALAAARDQEDHPNSPIQWAIAGRNEAKLTATLEECGEREPCVSAQRTQIGIIVADVEDESSVAAMAASTRILLNAVGPYSLLGEPVVRACITAGTHLLDITGEEAYMEKLQVDHFTAAQEAKVFILTSCAFGFLPMDLAVEYMRQEFGGELDSVELIFDIAPKLGALSLHTGTWTSMLSDRARRPQLPSIRRRFKEELVGGLDHVYPPSSASIRRSWPLFRCPEAGGWCVTVPGRRSQQPDAAVVERTQLLRAKLGLGRPIEYESGVRLNFHPLHLMLFGLIGATAGLFALCGRWGYKFLIRHPRLMSFGVATDEGLPRDVILKNPFKLTCIGRGRVQNRGDDLSGASPAAAAAAATAEPLQTSQIKKRTLLITGPDLGYLSTAICLVQSGVSLLRDSDRLPLGALGGGGGGGVYTTGVLLPSTQIVKRLNESGITFQFKD